ncbi:hypothetical protein DMUE_1645 [Dictyocoela muelleri]|nr:hypothetical protein DMUE_1645 [Dictyocoela muelleri]
MNIFYIICNVQTSEFKDKDNNINTEIQNNENSTLHHRKINNLSNDLRSSIENSNTNLLFPFFKTNDNPTLNQTSSEIIDLSSRESNENESYKTLIDSFGNVTNQIRSLDDLTSNFSCRNKEPETIIPNENSKNISSDENASRINEPEKETLKVIHKSLNIENSSQIFTSYPKNIINDIDYLMKEFYGFNQAIKNQLSIQKEQIDCLSKIDQILCLYSNSSENLGRALENYQLIQKKNIQLLESLNKDDFPNALLKFNEVPPNSNCCPNQYFSFIPPRDKNTISGDESYGEQQPVKFKKISSSHKSIQYQENQNNQPSSSYKSLPIATGESQTTYNFSFTSDLPENLSTIMKNSKPTFFRTCEPELNSYEEPELDTSLNKNFYLKDLLKNKILKLTRILNDSISEIIKEPVKVSLRNNKFVKNSDCSFDIFPGKNIYGNPFRVNKQYDFNLIDLMNEIEQKYGENAINVAKEELMKKMVCSQCNFLLSNLKIGYLSYFSICPENYHRNAKSIINETQKNFIFFELPFEEEDKLIIYRVTKSIIKFLQKFSNDPYISIFFPEIEIINSLYNSNIGNHRLIGVKWNSGLNIKTFLKHNLEWLKFKFPSIDDAKNDEEFLKLILKIRLLYFVDFLKFLNVKKAHLTAYSLLSIKYYYLKKIGYFSPDAEKNEFKKMFNESTASLLNIFEHKIFNTDKINYENFSI